MTRWSMLVVVALSACGKSSNSGSNTASGSNAATGSSVASGSGTTSSGTANAIDAPKAAEIVAAPDRQGKDLEIDKFRKPAELLVFVGVAPGMHIADLGAGTGYTSELLARAVGSTGAVVAQDSPHWEGDWMHTAWQQRLGRPAVANLKHVMRDWEDPIPPDARDLDAVTMFAAYHDVHAEKSDAVKLNAAVFAALKSGGVYIVIDNSAKEGTGTAACKTLHRIDEQVVRDEVQRAGFKLVGESKYLRHPDDARDWNADPGQDPRSRTQDLFALKFVKP